MLIESIVRRKHTKVLQTHDFHLIYTLYDSLALQMQLGASHKVKQQLNISNKYVNLCKNTKNTKYLLITQKLK